MFCQNDEEDEDVDDDDDIKHLEMPSDNDVGSALAMFGSNLGNLRMLQNLDKIITIMAHLSDFMPVPSFDRMIKILVATSWPVLGTPEVMEPWSAQGRSAEPRAE